MRHAAALARGTPGCCNAPTSGQRSSTLRGGCACYSATFSASEPARLTLLVVDGAFVRCGLGAADHSQGSPTRVDLFVPMARFDVLKPRSAIGAQAEAVFLAHRRERQREHHRIT